MGSYERVRIVLCVKLLCLTAVSGKGAVRAPLVRREEQGEAGGVWWGVVWCVLMTQMVGVSGNGALDTYFPFAI